MRLIQLVISIKSEKNLPINDKELLRRDKGFVVSGDYVLSTKHIKCEAEKHFNMISSNRSDEYIAGI